MTTGNPLHHACLGALAAGALTLAGNALAAPQGLYSTQKLLDAEVYTGAESGVAIGEVEDVLLDNDMQVRALVIDTGNLLDMGKKQYVIDANQFRVETLDGDRLDRIQYRVHVDLSEEGITQQPQYTNDWWKRAREGAQQAWEQTQEGAASAWETTKAGASRALDRIGQALENVGKKTQEAANGSQ